MTGARKTAANMTWRELLGQQIFQKIRALGQSNPSPAFLFNQLIPTLLWPAFRIGAAGIRAGWLSRLTKQPAASAWYGSMVKLAVVDVGGVPQVDGSLFAISKGTMTQTPFTAVASVAAHTIVLTFPATAADSTQNVADLTNIFIVNSSVGTIWDQTQAMKAEYGDAVRNDGTTTVTVPVGFFTLGQHLQVYLGFVADPLEANAGTSSSSVNRDVIAVA